RAQDRRRAPTASDRAARRWVRRAPGCGSALDPAPSRRAARRRRTRGWHRRGRGRAAIRARTCRCPSARSSARRSRSASVTLLAYGTARLAGMVRRRRPVRVSCRRRARSCMPTGGRMSGARVEVSLRRTSFALGLVKLVRALASLAAVSVTARFFGATVERDAWVIGTTVQTVFLQFAFGPVNEIFRAKFVHVQEESGPQTAFRHMAEWIAIALLVCALGVGLAWVGRRPFGHALAPGFDPGQTALVATMMLWSLPVVFLQQVASFWTVALNATGRYYLPDAWSIAGSVLQIGAIVLLARPLGIYALLVALYASTLLFCFVLWSFLRREAGFRAIVAPTWKTLRAYSHLSTPFYVPAVVAQASTLVERSLCSVLGAGTASILDYARRCVELPLGIVPPVTQTVVPPRLARHHARGEDRSASRRFGRFVILVIAAVVPLATLLAAGAPQVVQWVLAHGAFAPDRAAATS